MDSRREEKPPPDLVFNGIYCGTYHNTLPIFLNSFQIEAVLDCETNSKPFNLHPDQYFGCPMRDDGNTNLVEIIQTAVDWIHSKRLAGMNVLVQCEWGVNRSVTVIVAYLMIKEKINLVDAIKIVKSRRKQARPRDEYLAQLIFFENQLFGFSTSIQELQQLLDFS